MYILPPERGCFGNLVKLTLRLENVLLLLALIT